MNTSHALFRAGIGVSVAIAASLGVASATTITFTDYHVRGGTLGGEFDGARVTATAAIFDTDAFDEATRTGTATIDRLGRHDTAFLDASSYGLALTNAATDSNHQIDGLGTSDLALFEFSELVRLSQVTFSFVDASDDFVLFVDDGTGALSAFDLIDVMAGTVVLDVVGRVFGIGALDHTDAFKITSLTFEEAAPVPLPAAAPLFAGAMALAGVARRRKGRTEG